MNRLLAVGALILAALPSGAEEVQNLQEGYAVGEAKVAVEREVREAATTRAPGDFELAHERAAETDALNAKKTVPVSQSPSPTALRAPAHATAL